MLISAVKNIFFLFNIPDSTLYSYKGKGTGTKYNRKVHSEYIHVKKMQTS